MNGIRSAHPRQKNKQAKAIFQYFHTLKYPGLHLIGKHRKTDKGGVQLKTIVFENGLHHTGHHLFIYTMGTFFAWIFGF